MNWIRSLGFFKNANKFSLGGASPSFACDTNISHYAQFHFLREEKKTKQGAHSALDMVRREKVFGDFLSVRCSHLFDGPSRRLTLSVYHLPSRTLGYEPVRA